MGKIPPAVSTKRYRQNLNAYVFYNARTPARVLITSPAIIKPATEGTNDTLPGTLCPVFTGSSFENTTLSDSTPFSSALCASLLQVGRPTYYKCRLLQLSWVKLIPRPHAYDFCVCSFCFHNKCNL